MNKIGNYKLWFISFIIGLLLLASVANAKDEEKLVIYYQSQSTLYRMNLLDGQPEIVSNSVASPAFFSSDNNWLAFSDANNIMIAKFKSFAPEEIFKSNNLPLWGGLFWTPDNQFLIFNYANYTRQGELPSKTQSFIYNVETQQVSSWDWGNCTSVVRNLTTKKIALKCSAIPSSNANEIEPIALEWGGKQVIFQAQEYETLVDQITFPSNFDWSKINETEQIVFISDSLSPEIYISEGGEEPLALNLSSQYTINPSIIAVSPDRTSVAYIVRCDASGLTECLQISNLKTNTITWNYADTISASLLLQLKWSPDNNYVVMLGQDQSNNAIISAFNVHDGISQEFPIGDATGNLAVRIE